MLQVSRAAQPDPPTRESGPERVGDGPMTMYAQGWAQMADEDASAVARFVMTLPPIDNKVPASTFVPAGPPPAE
jgi:hypothetical protein